MEVFFHKHKNNVTLAVSTPFRTLPVHKEYIDYDDEAFISPSSIPVSHMPKAAMRDQLTRGGWEAPHQHYPRYWQVQACRESVKWDKWNDVAYADHKTNLR